MPDIMHLIHINAPADRAYEALTTSQGIRQWWTRDADLDGSVGGAGEFRFSSYGEPQRTRVEISALTPSLTVAWKVTFSFRPEWTGTIITFDLRAEADRTAILFAHRGFREADDIYALCTTGWGYYLVSLRQYLETGQGAPSPDIDFTRVLR